MFLGISYLKIQGSKRLFQGYLMDNNTIVNFESSYNCLRMTMPLSVFPDKVKSDGTRNFTWRGPTAVSCNLAN